MACAKHGCRDNFGLLAKQPICRYGYVTAEKRERTFDNAIAVTQKYATFNTPSTIYHLSQKVYLFEWKDINKS